MPSPTPPPDVSSLRAAALLTLRSKSHSRHLPIAPGKRTSPDYPDDISSVASTRRAFPSPELDYGSDDGLADAEGSTEEEDGGEKEEGEISEDEAPPKAPPTSVTAMNVDEEPLPGLMSSTNHRKTDSDLGSPQILRKQASSSALPSGNATTTNFTRSPPLKSTNPRLPSDSRARPFSFAKLPTPTSRPPLVPLPPAYTSALSVYNENANVTKGFQSIDTRHNGVNQATDNVRSGSQFPSESRVSEPASSAAYSDAGRRDSYSDLTYARPSLKMTVEELSEAKAIILDLLGWGVPSDYFVNCGLTREAIYYIFTELNLKLPGNFNVKDIELKGPSDYTHCTPGLREKIGDSTGVTDEQPAKIGATATTRPVILPFTSQHPLPLKPTAITSKAELSTQSNDSNSQTGMMNECLSPNGEELNSTKRSLSPSDPIPGLQGQFSAPHSTVSVSTISSDAPKHGYTGNLDEIETLRRKELLARKAVLASRKLKASASTSVPSAVINSSASSGRTTSPSVAPETVDNFLKSISSNVVDDGSSVVLKPSDAMEVDSERGPFLPSSEKARSATWSNPRQAQSPLIAEQQRPIPTRKSTLKRPVASDFVDYDATSHSLPSLDVSLADVKVNSGASFTITPSFANLAASRKVVIDFSDTEEEDTMEDIMADISYQMHPIQSPHHNSNGTGTPESGRFPTTTPGTPSITPDMLLQKELEIKRMKLLIAEREKNTVKRLAIQSKSVTLSPPLSSSTDTASTKSPISTQHIALQRQGEIALKQPISPTHAGGGASEDVVMSEANVPTSIVNMLDDPSVQSTDASTSKRNVIIQPQVLMSDVMHEQVAIDETLSSSLPIPVMAGVIQQAPNASEDVKRYSTYHSPLASFVTFTPPIPVVTLSTFSFLQSPSSSHNAFIPPLLSSLSPGRPILQQLPALLRPLKETILRKLDPKKSICQFEIPGAGKCRDPVCPNVHLCSFEPGDHETAQYLAKILPAPPPAVQVLKATLARIRASQPDLDLNARVSQALLQLGVR